ncbi:phospholipid scramblase family member 5 isoform X2 [Lasioglossum baleicum]|uniref:phospholipid scramblase family member 5 isoform X2 n=1 Tax=Lasioglossum baleicum TaxID=434251 RepID=UPI003FCC5D33
MVQEDVEVSGLNRTTSRSEDVVANETIEMQETPYEPPFAPASRVIEAQPHGQVRQSRRPIPTSSLDWVSIPRSQLTISALSGTHFLGNVDQLQVQQVVDLSTLLGRPERGTQYRVKVPRGETMFLAVQANSEIGSNRFSCLNLIRGRGNIEFSVLDKCGMLAFVTRINTGWTHALGKSHKITVENTGLLGTVEENFSLMGANFTVYDDAHSPLCSVVGPNVCGCCMYKEAQFQVITNDGTQQIATLMHQWDSTLHDYILLVTFPENTDIKLKSLLLGAAFLLEHMFFEQTGTSPRT